MDIGYICTSVYIFDYGCYPRSKSLKTGQIKLTLFKIQSDTLDHNMWTCPVARNDHLASGDLNSSGQWSLNGTGLSYTNLI